jgi:NADP-dependent 3-hydroxy acid dehydrogenase YdfG
MSSLKDKIAWITGAGSGIGEAAAIALAKAAATVILTGRRAEPLEKVALAIKAAGGQAHMAPGDLTQSDTAGRIAARIEKEFGRLDILVNNAGLNIAGRMWRDLTPQGIDDVVRGNLSSAMYCVAASLPMMRKQKDGLLIHTASLAGRFLLPGPGYIASKHGVVAMSHAINLEECVNGIRSTCICPGEVATPILDKRPVPVSAQDRARMVQSEDVGDLVLYVAQLPRHVCMNEVLITPTWNRGYIAQHAQPHIKV